MKLQILIPQYTETDEIIKPLLDSIAIQQNVDFKNDIGVIIVNDGTDIHLSNEFLSQYPFTIEYYLHDHLGVSATRNACLDYATAEYVMFCDADDMFCNVCGIYIILKEINKSGFDTFSSLFIEESRNPQTQEVIYVNRPMDATFVHGKVHRRQYLIDNGIRWNNKLTIHEDSYFNCLCQRLTSNSKYCPTAFYLWRWRQDSVCRSDFKYILKTYKNLIDSSEALVEEFLHRGRLEDAQFYCTLMIYDAYFTMNKQQWINQENREYRLDTERRFKDYYLKFNYLYQTISETVKNQIIVSLKNRMFKEGLIMESITFEDWITTVEGLE